MSKKMTREEQPSAEPHPNDKAVGLLYEAKAIFSDLSTDAGRSPAGRCYNIVTTELEKLIHVEAGYFPRRP